MKIALLDLKMDLKLLLICFVMMIILGIPSLFIPKIESFLWLNQYHTDFLDYFFIGYTYLGDGMFSVFLILLFFLLKKRTLALHTLIAFLFSGLLAQIGKKIASIPRPKNVLSDSTYDHFIEGVTHGGFTSFPSGHTTSAFALAMILSIYTKNTYLRLLYFSLALMVGFSRIYLGQHFVPDIFGGFVTAFLTILIVVLIFLLIKRNKQKHSIPRH